MVLVLVEEWFGWKNAKEAFVFLSIRSQFNNTADSNLYKFTLFTTTGGDIRSASFLFLVSFSSPSLPRLYCVFPAQLFGRLVQWGQILT